MHIESQRPASEIVAVDLFCGAGGLTKGLREANIQVQLGIDADGAFRKTYEENNQPAKFWHKKIQSVSGAEISQFLKVGQTQKLLLAACAPCQPFSRQNNKSVLRGFGDDRKDLMLEVIRIINEMKRKPDFIFVENVPGMSDLSHGVHNRVRKYLQNNGYSIVDGVTNAVRFGVPQNRRRFILIGVKGACKLEFPPETHGKNKLPYATVRSALKGLPPLRAGGESRKVANHKARNLSPINLQRIKGIPKDGGSRKDLQENLIVNCHRKSKGHYDVYGRMAWDTPSPTLTCRCVSFSNGRYGHPTQNRAISVREAARIQTFPDDYKFYGTGIDSEARQVGNAVPPLLAKKFGEHFQRILVERYQNK